MKRVNKIAFTLALTALITSTSPASAHETTSDSAKIHTSSTTDQSAEQTLTAELRVVFEVYLKHDEETGQWKLNDTEAATAAGVKLQDLETIVRGLNSVETSTSIPTGNRPETIGDRDWARCVIGWSVGSGVLGVVDGTVANWLKRGKYMQVASWLLRTVPRIAFRGVAGIVGGLVAGVAACSITNG